MLLQTSIPINSANIDYITWVTSAIDSLVLSGSGLFLTTGTQILTALGVIMLVIYGLKWASASASRHWGEFDFPAAIHFFALFLVAEAMLRYYNTPLPWTSSSVSSILPDTTRYFAGQIDLTILDTLLVKTNALQANMLSSMFLLNSMMLWVYSMIMVVMFLMQGTMFSVNVLSFVAIGIGGLVGPLFIPWLIVPRWSGLFWNWLQFMLKYSFYRVIASAVTYIWATVLVRFIDNTIHGDYSIGHMLAILYPLAMVMVGFVVSAFKIGSFVSDLFNGAAMTGASLGGSVSNSIRGMFR